MRRSWSALVLVGALLLLVSLYLPWERASSSGRDPTGFLNLLSGDGWASGVGPAAALSALLLTAVAAVALARPNLSCRLPLGRCALFAGYFAVAVGAGARSAAQRNSAALDGAHFDYGYGAYFGIAGGIIALIAAGAMRRRELERYHSASRIVILALVVGLLVAFLLPWVRFVAPTPYAWLGITTPAATVAAVLALCLPVGWSQAHAHTERLVFAAATALFTDAALRSLPFSGSRAYGAWVGLGVAGAILAFGLVAGVRAPRPELPPWHAIATAGAAALLVTGLFLPWQVECYAKGSDFAPNAGICFSTNGWTTPLGPAAAVLAIGLVIASLWPQRAAASGVALAAGIGLLIATLGFQLSDMDFDGGRLEFGYGSTIGFVAAGLLVLLAVVRAWPPFDSNRILVRLAPIIACVAYLVVLMLPLWNVLPRHVQSALRIGPLSWLPVAGALLAVWLTCEWAGRIAGTSEIDERLILIPLAMLGLAALDLIQLRAGGITWGGGAVVGLCLLLAQLGGVEQRGGLESLRIPEILRVDRL